MADTSSTLLLYIMYDVSRLILLYTLLIPHKIENINIYIYIYIFNNTYYTKRKLIIIV